MTLFNFETSAHYLGFVNIRLAPDELIGDVVTETGERFSRQNIKATQQDHSLFARGVKNVLVKVTAEGVAVKDGKACILEIPANKISLVSQCSKNVLVFTKKVQKAQYSCKAIRCATKKKAEELSNVISAVEGFRRRGSDWSMEEEEIDMPTSSPTSSPTPAPVLVFDSVLETNLGTKRARLSLQAFPQHSYTEPVAARATYEEPTSGSGSYVDIVGGPMYSICDETPPRRASIFSMEDEEERKERLVREQQEKERKLFARLEQERIEREENAFAAFYVGDCDRREAEKMLSGRASGTFLVRSSLTRNGLSLSLVGTGTQGIIHFMIEEIKGQFRIGGHQVCYATVPILVNHYSNHHITLDGDSCIFPVNAC